MLETKVTREENLCRKHKHTGRYLNRRGQRSCTRCTCLVTKRYGKRRKLITMNKLSLVVLYSSSIAEIFLATEFQRQRTASKRDERSAEKVHGRRRTDLRKIATF